MGWFLAMLAWPFQIFCESDGKPSFSRVFGAYTIWKIIWLADQGKVIPDGMMSLFYVLVGYQLISKSLNMLSPAALDFAKTALIKVQGNQIVNAPTPAPIP